MTKCLVHDTYVIEKVSIPTPWVSSMVTIVLVKPNGILRTCIYSQNLNKVIIYEHYLIQTHQAYGYQNAQCNHLFR